MDGNHFLLLLAAVTLVAMAASPVLTAQFILRPVFSAGRGRSVKTHYGVSDLVCLMFYLSLLATLVKLARFEVISSSQETALMAVAGFYAVCTWWIGVGALGRAEISDTLRRSVFLSVAVPLSYAGLAMIPPATFLLVLAVFHWQDANAAIGSLPVGLAVYVLLIVGLVLSRQIAVWACEHPAAKGGDEAPE